MAHSIVVPLFAEVSLAVLQPPVAEVELVDVDVDVAVGAVVVAAVGWPVKVAAGSTGAVCLQRQAGRSVHSPGSEDQPK